MYPNPTNFQVPMFSPPSFYPPVYSMMPMTPDMSHFCSPSSFPFSVATRLSASSNSSTDSENWTFQQPISPPFELPYSRSVSSTSESPLRFESLTSPTEFLQKSNSAESSIGKKCIPIIDLSDTDDESHTKQRSRKVKKDRMAKGIRKLRKITSRKDDERLRLTLGTYLGKKVVLKLMDPRKPSE